MSLPIRTFFLYLYGQINCLMNKLSFTFLLFFSFLTIAQEDLPKNHIGLSLNAWVPLFGNQKQSEFYKFKDGKIVKEDDYLDWGLRLSYDRMIARRIAIGLEVGADFFSIHKESSQGYNLNSYYEVHYENRDVVSYALMPKASLYSREYSNFGKFVHQLGVGMWYADMIYKKYHDQTFNTSAKLRFYNKENIGVTLMYSLKMQKQLTKRLSFNYGFRLTYHYMPWPAKYAVPGYYAFYSNDGNNAFSYYLNKRTRWMFARFDAGLVFSL